MAGAFTVQLDDEFKKYLGQLIEHTGINNDELFNGCIDIHKSLNMSAADLLQIATNLKVDPILLWNKKIDFDVIKSDLSGETIFPSCYSEVLNSNIVSLKNVLDQFKRYDIYDYALKKIQFDEKTLNNNKAVSILAINDLLEFSTGFFTEKNYAKIAKANATFMFDNVFKKEVSLSNSPINIAKNMVELVSHFEQNWDYEILKTDLNSLTMKTWESEKMRSTKSYRPYTNYVTNYLRFEFVHKALEQLGVGTYNVTPLSEWDNRDKSFKFKITLN